MTCLVNLNYNYSSKKNMKDSLVLSSGKNKSSFFNGLQAKLTVSYPVVFTIFPHLYSGNKNNDKANNSLKKLPNIKLSIRFWLDFAPKLIRENRAKLSSKSIKVSRRFFTTVQIMPSSLTGYFLKIDF